MKLIDRPQDFKEVAPPQNTPMGVESQQTEPSPATLSGLERKVDREKKRGEL
jgi:hypothetical protein